MISLKQFRQIMAERFPHATYELVNEESSEISLGGFPVLHRRLKLTGWASRTDTETINSLAQEAGLLPTALPPIVTIKMAGGTIEVG